MITISPGLKLVHQWLYDVHLFIFPEYKCLLAIIVLFIFLSLWHKIIPRIQVHLYQDQLFQSFNEAQLIQYSHQDL